MFSQSYTFRFFKSIGDKIKNNKLSELIKCSVVCRFIVWMTGLVVAQYRCSVVHHFVEWIGSACAADYSKSITKKYINLKLFWNELWSSSWFAWLADKIFGLPVFLIQKTGDFAVRLTKGSLTEGVLTATFGRLGYARCMAIIFSAIFLCYSSFWNNLYALAAALVLFVIMLYNDREKLVKPSKLDFFMVLFGISMVLGVLVAPDKADAVRIVIIAVTALIFMLVTSVSLNSNEKVKSFLNIMTFAITVTAVIAICQRFMGIEVNPEFVDVETNAGMPGRVFSTMENPNNYAELLVLFMPFMFALFIDAKNGRGKLLTAGAIIVTFIALAMTYSRSCYVAIALAMVIFVLVYDYRMIFPLIGLGILAVPFLPDTIMNRIFTIGSLQDSSNSYRLYIWDTCVRLIVNYGVSGLGIGPAAFAEYYKPIADKAAMLAPHSHMLYMELILEYGLLGFIGFFGYYIRAIRNGLRTVKIASKKERAYIAAGVGALCGISFVSMAEYIWFYPRDMFAHFIVIGLLVAITRNIRKGRGMAE